MRPQQPHRDARQSAAPAGGQAKAPCQQARWLPVHAQEEAQAACRAARPEPAWGPLAPAAHPQPPSGAGRNDAPLRRHSEGDVEAPGSLVAHCPAVPGVSQVAAQPSAAGRPLSRRYTAPPLGAAGAGALAAGQGGAAAAAAPPPQAWRDSLGAALDAVLDAPPGWHPGLANGHAPTGGAAAGVHCWQSASWTHQNGATAEAAASPQEGTGSSHEVGGEDSANAAATAVEAAGALVGLAAAPDRAPRSSGGEGGGGVAAAAADRSLPPGTAACRRVPRPGGAGRKGRSTPRQWTPDEDERLRACAAWLLPARLSLLLVVSKPACEGSAPRSANCKRTLLSQQQSSCVTHSIPAPPPWVHLYTCSLVLRIGTGKWSALAAEGFPASPDGAVAPRTGKQCRERWLTVFANPSYRKPWTPEDDEVLKVRIAAAGPLPVERECPGGCRRAPGLTPTR